MEEPGTTASSNIKDTVKSVLRGKETPEEREKALIDFIEKYEESANECIEDWKKRASEWENRATEWKTSALAKNTTTVLVGLLCLFAGVGITALFLFL